MQAVQKKSAQLLGGCCHTYAELEDTSSATELEDTSSA